MVPLRASQERNLTPSASSEPVTTYAPAGDAASQARGLQGAAAARDLGWICGIAALYAALVIVAVLALNPYFSQTWDAVTFVKAGKTLASPQWNALYEVSRADRVWPYAYPPLHAVLVAPAVAAAGVLPDWLLVRLPALLFDIALGILLYEFVAHKTRAVALARAALVVWLLNPVTWYDTAVQGHFEAEWLLFVVLAYWLYETRGQWALASLALAAAFLFKQNAILFALPLWAQLLFADSASDLTARAARVQRIWRTLASLALFALPVLLVSLPFLLYSNDYWFMNVQYVAEVPLQTQSWLVGLAGFGDIGGAILRASTALTLVAAAVIAFLTARRGAGLAFAGMLIALAFFLLSKKVVGYYYVMVVPFALLTLLPGRHYRALTLIVGVTAFISLSPYFAGWADPAHRWIYALLGIANSLFWLGMIIWVWRLPTALTRDETRSEDGRLANLVFLAPALVFAASAAALVQPWINSQSSPIRAPLVAPGTETSALGALIAFAALVALGCLGAILLKRTVARRAPISPSLYAIVVLLAPLYFLTFALTKESTAALELALKTLGL